MSSPDDHADFKRHEASPFFREEVRSAVAQLGPVVGRRVWDLGCGGGSLVRHLTLAGARATGLDVRADALAWGTSGGNGSFVRGRAEALPICDGSLDGIVAQHLIEHMEDPGGALREWRRCLGEGGVLVLVTPNRRYPDPSIFSDPTHRRIYTEEDLRKAVATAEFVVQEAYTIFPYLRGHTVFGLRHYRLFRKLPGFRRAGRTLILKARRPGPSDTSRLTPRQSSST